MNNDANIIWTVDEALAVIGRKKVKGTLTISEDGYWFSGKMNIAGKYDIRRVQVWKSTLSVSGFFGTKSKPALRIVILGKEDAFFAMNEESISIIIAKVYNVIARKNIFRKAEALLSKAATVEEYNEVFRLYSSIKDYPLVQLRMKECDQMKETLQKKLYDKAEELFCRATTLAEYDEVTKLYASIPQYSQSQSRIQECTHKTAILKDKLYSDAKYQLKNVGNPKDYESIIEILVTLGDYKDAKQLIAACRVKKQELERQEVIVNKAETLLDKAKTIADYEAVYDLYASIPTYPLIQSKIQECIQKKEALQKKIDEEARREAEKITQIKNAQLAPDAIEDVKQRITGVNRKALELFLNNPFRVLGISRAASVEDAQTVLDKFKKLERLKALNSYTSPFHLKHFVKPDRSSAVIQATLGTLSDVKHQVLWFETSVGCTAWNSAEYRVLTRKLSDIDYDEYDVFLANYIYVLVYDPTFANDQLWKPVFKKMIDFIKEGDGIASRFNGAEKVESFGELFEKQISKPIVAIIEESDISGLKNLYEAIDGMTALKTISQKLDSRLSRWFETATRTIDKEINDLGKGENAAPERVEKAKQLFVQLKNVVKPELVWAKAHYSAKSVRLTMFQDEYRGTGWSLMCFLFLAGEKTYARLIADDIEEYCNDEQKEAIKYGIREAPKPRPKPVPPEHEHYDLDYVFISYSETKIVEVTLNYSANVYLMEDSDFDDYMHCRRFGYYGGRATSSPYRIKIPSFGHWHLVVDDGPGGLGGVSSRVKVRTISNY